MNSNSIKNECSLRHQLLMCRYSPFGIMCLIAGKFLEIKDLARTAQQLGLYMITIITGLVVHAVGTLSILYFVITRKNPAVFFKGLLQAWVTALGTASRCLCFAVTRRRCTYSFSSLAVLDPRVGHTMDVLSPFISVLCHSD